VSEPLAPGFDPVSYREWLEKATSGDESIEPVTRLADGIEAKWLYTKDDALAPDPAGLPLREPFVRGTRAGHAWQVRQENGNPERSKANSQILEDLLGGSTEVTVLFDRAARLSAAPEDPPFLAGRGAGGIAISTLSDLSEVLDGVLLDVARVALDAGSAFLPAASFLAGIWAEREIEPEAALGSFRADPVGTLAGEGELPYSAEEGLAYAARLALESARTYRSVRALGVDTSPYVSGGATPAWELAFALSTAVEHLRAGDAEGMEPASVARTLEFTLSAGSDQFLEMAKFRAIRRLWSRVLEECGVEPDSRRSATYARTAGRMLTWVDPWVNMLRTTAATFAAGAAGADGVSVTPFDRPLGVPGELGRRIARNTQTIVQDEAAVGRTADPLAGSWYGESLTDQLTTAAWERFQEIEGAGGMVAALRSGAIQATLIDQADRFEDELLHRERVMTAVNEFPILDDDRTDTEPFDRQPLARLEAERLTETDPVDCSALAGEDLDRLFERAVALARAGARIDEMIYALDGEPEQADPITPRPDAAPFEQLRKVANDHEAKTGEPLRIFLACPGSIASHVSQANWAKSFFESGGITTVPSGALPGNAELADAFAEGGFEIAAVCAGKETEPDQVADLVARLRKAGASFVYLVRPAPGVEEVAGADDVVRDGVDMQITLAGALGRLGVA
jgi:methylmalonyl-CoA mutase